MKRVGERLLADGRIDDALVAFELNIDRNPHTWRVYESLGDGLFAVRQDRRAAAAYRRALELEPDNWNSAHQRSQLAAIARRRR